MAGTMETFTRTLFKLLRDMDAEAVANASGSPTGLNWYGAHYEPQKKRPRTEVSWSLRLAELLPLNGYPTRAEVPYPMLRRCKCDNVITMPDRKSLWMENKGAWKDYWLKMRKPVTYRSYLLHPLMPGLDKSKSHTVPLDFKKLATLTKPAADYVALLLVGFDTDDAPMAADIAELIKLAGLDKSPWSTASEHWPDRHRRSANVRCWFWWRPID